MQLILVELRELEDRDKPKETKSGVVTIKSFPKIYTKFESLQLNQMKQFIKYWDTLHSTVQERIKSTVQRKIS